MRTALIVSGAFALITGCGEPATAPSRAAPTAPSFSVDNSAYVYRAREERSYSDTITTCEGDVAVVVADLDRRQQLLFLPDGGLRSTDHLVVRMRGTVLSSGVQYVGQLSWIQVHVSRGPDSGVPATETRTIRLHRVTQGPTDNMFETIRFETIYEDGSYTVVTKGKAACPG
ncbi:MAG TPA: hypothetical protein VLN49_05160 [Gemmatimonadaceae bacterium]|nr:hypothetical protein [Gemmatimonadaceae bacterium]